MRIDSLIGNTPLVELTGFDTGNCQIFLKLESQNPGGSIKDRIALSMINDAERSGALRPGGTIVEATAGNTGIGLALLATIRGYRVVLVVPDKMSREKISHLQALGAEVVLTRSDVERGHPDYYQDRASALAREIEGGWFVDQFSNPANPQAHEQTTGPEIFQQMEGKVDAIVVGVGSGGTLGGLTKFFQRVKSPPEMVIADPVGSIIAEYVSTGKIRQTAGSWLVEGIGEDFIPLNADFSLVKRAFSISDRESFLTARKLLRTSGILAGSSTGTLLAAALHYCREQNSPKRVVTFVCDGGVRYLSKMFNDFWMVDQGFLEKSRFGDLRDLISREYSSGAVISVSPIDTVGTAYKRMKMYDVSQLPVLSEGKIIGLVDESDLLFNIRRDQTVLQHSVQTIMTTTLTVLRPNESLDRVLSVLSSGLTALIADEHEFYGVITKMDVVDYLRKS